MSPAHVLAPCLLLLLAPMGCTCGDGPGPEAAPEAIPTAAPARPNVVFIVVDTLRADHLGAYGRSPTITPNLDALAERGTRFDHCSAAASTTLASITSALTGTYPHTHGVYRNGVAWPDRVVGVQSAFQNAGYRTAGFVSTHALNPSFGIKRGFDVWRWPKKARSLRSPRPIGQITRWLAARPDGEPFFAFLHLFDPHYPYQPPPPFDTRFDANYTGTMTGSHGDLKRLRKALRQGVQGAERDAQHVQALYVGEVAYLDRQMAALWSTLSRLGRWEDTIVLLTADHGETFTEHATTPFDHGYSVYDTEVHVPLILVGPGVPAGHTVPTPVSNVDLAPTLLDLAGLPASMPVEGVSLKPLLSGGAAAGFDGRAHFSEATRPHPPPGDWPNHVLPRAIVQNGLKLQRWPRRRGRLELYDLEKDPGETTNLAEEPARAAERRALRQRLDAWGALTPKSTGAMSDDPAVLEQLRALGYIE